MIHTLSAINTFYTIAKLINWHYRIHIYIPEDYYEGYCNESLVLFFKDMDITLVATEASIHSFIHLQCSETELINNENLLEKPQIKKS